MRQLHQVSCSRAAAAVALCALGCAPYAATRRAGPTTSLTAGAPPLPSTALAVDSALAVMGAAPLWPNFEPLRTPVAIFDGRRTYLFRHPSPPAEYAAVDGRRDVVVREGRDPAVTANTSALLGAVPTATVMLESRTGTPELAALTVHELFHVFQRARHPSWQGNEADLFTYRVDDTTALALRREEWSALRQSLDAGSADSMRCWGRAFIDARRQRFAVVGAAGSAYERGTELNEGLAQYVERRALGRQATLDPADPSAAQVRQRAYAVGAALASLLDRTSLDWRDALERSADKATPPLDSLLADAMGPTPTADRCAPPGAQRAAWAAAAADDVRALRAARARARSEYLARPGWRLVVEAGDAPFFPQGFDPLNVARLSDTEILHTRFLKLQGTLGSIDLLAAQALTEGTAGSHPLFAGVRRVTVTGVAAPLAIRDSAGTLAVDAGGVRARLRGVRADTTGETIRLMRR